MFLFYARTFLIFSLFLLVTNIKYFFNFLSIIKLNAERQPERQMERHRILLERQRTERERQRTERERQRTERERRMDAKGTRWCQVIFTVNYL